jgi:hypothetical protein
LVLKMPLAMESSQSTATCSSRSSVTTRPWRLLTPKIGTGKGLTCGPSLVTKCYSAGKISLEDSVKMLAVGNKHHLAKGLFALLKGSFRECMMTWPRYKEGTN